MKSNKWKQIEWRSDAINWRMTFEFCGNHLRCIDYYFSNEMVNSREIFKFGNGQNARINIFILNVFLYQSCSISTTSIYSKHTMILSKSHHYYWAWYRGTISHLWATIQGLIVSTNVNFIYSKVRSTNGFFSLHCDAAFVWSFQRQHLNN